MSETVSKLIYSFNFYSACYFGSLVQVLFHLPNIQHKILNYKDTDTIFADLKDIDESKMDEAQKVRLKASKNLIKHMQKLFASMLLSNVKYQDPTVVLESIVDDNAHKIPIYEQKDVGEFWGNFLDRLQDGLGENKNMIRKLMGDDLIKNMAQDGVIAGQADCKALADIEVQGKADVKQSPREQSEAST